MVAARLLDLGAGDGTLTRLVAAHLRWYEGDADQLTPSLFVGHRRRSASAPAPGEGGAAGEPSDPSESD